MFHFVTGGVTPAALAADWLTSAIDQNAFSWVNSPLASRLEQLAISWLKDLFGLPATWGGVLTTGATMANFSALAAARHWWGERYGVDIEEDGLGALPHPITVLAGGYLHTSAAKAFAMLGIGRGAIRRLPADASGRIDLDAVEDALRDLDGRPVILAATAGDVDTGAFDPIRADGGARRADIGCGCTWMVPSACSRGCRRHRRTWSTASRAPTRSSPTATSGSTCPTTAALPSCATPSSWPDVRGRSRLPAASRRSTAELRLPGARDVATRAGHPRLGDTRGVRPRGLSADGRASPRPRPAPGDAGGRGGRPGTTGRGTPGHRVLPLSTRRTAMPSALDASQPGAGCEGARGRSGLRGPDSPSRHGLLPAGHRELADDRGGRR